MAEFADCKFFVLTFVSGASYLGGDLIGDL